MSEEFFPTGRGGYIPGLADASFIRGEVPMTKREVRAVTLCQAMIRSGDTVWDIGAGTGSLTVESALLAWSGRVYAVERDPAALELIKQNTARFNLSNVHIVAGNAPEALAQLPQPDRVLIGGSGGNLPQILAVCRQQLRPGGRIVVNAVTLETLWQSMQTLEGWGFRVEASGVQVTRLAKVQQVHIWQPLHPVYIVTGTEEEQGEW